MTEKVQITANQALPVRRFISSACSSHAAERSGSAWCTRSTGMWPLTWRGKPTPRRGALVGRWYGMSGAQSAVIRMCDT